MLRYSNAPPRDRDYSPAENDGRGGPRARSEERGVRSEERGARTED
jgi:hypothetical protein